MVTMVTTAFCVCCCVHYYYSMVYVWILLNSLARYNVVRILMTKQLSVNSFSVTKQERLDKLQQSKCLTAGIPCIEQSFIKVQISSILSNPILFVWMLCSLRLQKKMYTEWKCVYLTQFSTGFKYDICEWKCKTLTPSVSSMSAVFKFKE